MVVCTHFLQGRCKFGDRCRNEHPGQQTVGTANRFGVLGGGGGGGGFGNRPAAQAQQQNYGLTAADIKIDLTAGKGRPEWIFSCYGPGRNAPRLLFGGPQREQSFEELRLRHYEASAAGNPNQAVQEAQNIYAEAVKQIDVILNDVDGAIKYIIDGENEHPNRIDITEGKTGPSLGQAPSAFSQPSAFGQPAAAAAASGQGSAFGQPSAVGAQPTIATSSGFGQASFGQPAALGQGSSFGQPSSLGQGSAFGKPSGLGGQSAFGKPAFGQSSFGQPAFGQTASVGTSAFGKPSAASPFSQIVNQNQGAPNAFGQPSGQTTVSPFAQAANQQTSGFGQPSTTQATTTTTPPFGQPTQPAAPFGQPQQAQNPFGKPAQGPSPFAGAAQQQPTPSGFGQPAASTGFAQTTPAPAAQPVAPVAAGPPPVLKTADPNELTPVPPLSGQTLRDPMTKRLSAWKGQPVKYVDNAPCYLHPQDRKTYVHIFFPNGPPDAASLKDAQGTPESYTPEVTEQYEFFTKNGYFKDGIIPSVPPKTEWVSFDF